MKNFEHKTEAAQSPDEDSWLELVRRQVNSLRFGVVQVVVHESRVVQIDRTEKVRLMDPIAVSGADD